MRVLFFALLVAVASAALTTPRQIRLTAGQTYVYDYESRLLSGIPGLGDQFAGLELSAQIVMQPSSADSVMMKFVNVQLGKHNGPIGESAQPQMQHQMAQQMARELQKPIRFVYSDGKVKAFEAEESELEWSLNMKKAVLSLLNVNLSPKKIIKSVQNNQIFRPDADLTVYPVYEDGIGGLCETVYELNQIPYEKSIHSIQDFQYVLNVTKTRNYDNCLTEPTIVNDNYDLRGCPWVCRKDKSQPAVPGYYPTPDAVNDPYMSGCPCGQEPHESPVDAYAFTKYNISLVSGHPVIESVFSDAKIVYKTNGDELEIKTQQNLTLSAQGSVPTHIPSIQRPKRHQELAFRLPKPSALSNKAQLDIPYYYIFGQPNIEELRQLIPQLLESLADDIVSGDIAASKESLQKSVQMVNALAVLEIPELVAIYEQVADEGRQVRATQKQQVQRKLFLDSLPLSGSNNAALFIKQLILADKVSTSEAKELIEAVPQNLFLVDTETIDAYLELYESPKVQHRRHLASSTGIAFAKMVKEACVKRQTTPGDIPDGNAVPHQIRGQQAQQIVQSAQPSNRVTVQSPISQRMRRSAEWEQQFPQQVCTAADLQKYVQIMGRLLENANTFHQKVTLIETLAHMGVPQVLPILEPYVSGKISSDKCPGYPVEKKSMYAEECDFIRQISIYALSHVAEYFPKQVLPLVLPVYSDPSESYAVRIAAFSNIITSGAADKQVYERIAAELHRESNRQIRSFVYSALQTVGNASAPCFHKSAQFAAQAFQHAPESDYGYQYSKMIGSGFYDDQKDFGLYTVADWVANNNSRVPRAGYLAVGQTSGPFQDDLIQVGFNAKGMESIVERILEPSGLLADMFEGLNAKGKDRRVTKRNADSAQQALEALKSKLKLQMRSDDEPKATIFVKMLDRTAYYALDKHYIHSLVDSLEDQLKDIAQWLMQGMDYHYVKLVMPQQLYKVLPSEIGLPVVVSHRHPTILSLKIDQAKLQLETTPKTVYPTGANITAQIQPSLYYSSYAFAFAVNPAERTAYGAHIEKTTQLTFPAEISVGYSRPKNLFTWSVIPKTQQQEIVYHKTQGKTFIAKANIASAADRDWLHEAKEVKKMAVPFKHDETYGVEELGLGVRVQMNTENPWETQPLYSTHTYKEHGFVAAAIQQWRNPGVHGREVHVTLESDAEEPISGYDFTLRYKWIADADEGKDNDDSDESSASSESDSDESDHSSSSQSSESKSSESNESKSSSSKSSKSSKSSEESNESKSLKQKIRQRMGKVVNENQRNRRSVGRKESHESSDESSNESGSKSFSKSGSKSSSQSSSSEDSSSEEKRKNKSKNSSKASKSAKSSESSSSSSSESDESRSMDDKVFGYQSIMKLILKQDFKRQDIKRVAKQLIRKTQHIWSAQWDEDNDSSSSDESNQNEKQEVPATISHDFAFTAVARGPRPTFYAANVLYVHTYDHRIVWIKTDGHVKTPKGVYLTVPTLFCADGVIAYPTLPNEFYYEPTQLQSQKARLQAHLGWGEQCHSEGGVIVTGVFESTEDRVITAQDLAVQDGDSAAHVQNWYYRQCAIDRASGQPQSYACERALIADSYFNQFIVDIKYKHVPKELQNLTAKAAMALKVALYEHLDIDASASNADNQIRLTAQYSSRVPDIHLANIELKSPKETLLFERIPAPYARPISSLLPTAEVFANLLTGYDAQDKCALMEDYVRTFDNVTYKMPESPCQYLLAKDCSPKERFAVFAQQLNAETKTKTITVITAGQEIKLLPPQQQNVAQVVISGHTHELTARKPITLANDQNEVRIYLRHTPSDAQNPIVVVEADLEDLEIKYDGKNAKVSIGSQYSGKTCGLCGDNNDESDDEFSGPDFCQYDYSEDFANSYALSGQHCEQAFQPKGPKRCANKRYDSSEDSSSEESIEAKVIAPNGQIAGTATTGSQVVQAQANTEELARQQQQQIENQMARQQNGQQLSPEQKQAMIGQTAQQQQLIQRLRTQYIQRDDMICFTTRPVLSCVANRSVAKSVKSVKLDFHCLPKSSPFTQQLIQDSANKVLKQLQNKRVDLRQVVDVPVACVAAA